MRNFQLGLDLRNSHRSGEGDTNAIKPAEHYVTAVLQKKAPERELGDLELAHMITEGYFRSSSI